MSFFSEVSLFPSQLSLPSNIHESAPANAMEELINNVGAPSLPCSSYHLIKYAFEKYSDKVIKYTLSQLNFDSSEWNEDDALEFKTSCVITGYALTMILLGQQAALKFNKRLNISHSMLHAVSLGGIDHFVFSLTNLFNGAVIKQINDDKDFDSLDEKEQSAHIEYKFKRINKNFIDEIQPEIEAIKNDSRTKFSKIDSLKKIILNTNYNDPVFESLKQEFVKNENQISEKQSCLYTICIKEGGIYGNSPSQHFILIDQFLFKGEIRYRLYDSFIKEATLLQSFELRNYGKNEEGTWNKEQLNIFLNDFQNCYVSHISDEERYKRIKQCFGFEFAYMPLHSLDKTTFSGLTLRYYSQKFDKAKAYENLVEIISSPD